jgi:Ni,Fe-hydrogenase III small subunit
MLPWGRVARRRFVECGPDGTFEAKAVLDALDAKPRPRLLAVTGASNVTGWLPPLESIVAGAHERGVPVVVDAAQLAPPPTATSSGRLRRVQRPQDVRAVRRGGAHRPAIRFRGGRPVPGGRRRG